MVIEFTFLVHDELWSSWLFINFVHEGLVNAAGVFLSVLEGVSQLQTALAHFPRVPHTLLPSHPSSHASCHFGMHVPPTFFCVFFCVCVCVCLRHEYVYTFNPPPPRLTWLSGRPAAHGKGRRLGRAALRVWSPSHPGTCRSATPTSSVSTIYLECCPHQVSPYL